ncbi:MAG: NAD(P)-dependent oxidoreductase, partial [Paracoccaceae bacterium]
MTIKVQFSARPDLWDRYRAPLTDEFAKAGLEVNLQQVHDPVEVDYVVFAPQPGPALDFTKYTRLRAVLGLWAGVENILENGTLNVPLTRMADSSLRDGMVEWVTGHVLRYHLGIDQQLNSQNGVWAPISQPLAHQRRVGILGLGALGAACAKSLTQLNFQVSGWSRSAKSFDGVTCYSGGAGLTQLLRSSEILV